MTAKLRLAGPPALPPELEQVGEPVSKLDPPAASAAPEPEESHQSSGAVPPPDIIPGIFPAAEVHLLSGASGVGKTAMIADMASRISRGQPVLGEIFVPRPPKFLGFIAADRTWKDHQQWFELVGLPDISHYSLINDLQGVTGKKLRARTKGDRFDLFCQSVDKLCKGDPPHDSLIFVDPISLFLGGNLIDYDRVYSYMVDLSQYCIKFGITLLGLCHTSKQKGDAKQRYSRPQDRINGTTAQTGCAGTVFHLAPPSEVDNPWYEFTWVPHHAPSETIKLIRDSQGLFASYDGPEITEEVKAKVTARSLREQIRDQRLTAIVTLLPEGGERDAGELLAEITTTLAVSRAQAYRYLAILVTRGDLEAGTAPASYRRARKN